MEDWSLSECPMCDTPECVVGGPAFGWSPEDFRSFGRAFFGNKILAEAFVKPK